MDHKTKIKIKMKRLGHMLQWVAKESMALILLLEPRRLNGPPPTIRKAVRKHQKFSRISNIKKEKKSIVNSQKKRKNSLAKFKNVTTTSSLIPRPRSCLLLLLPLQKSSQSQKRLNLEIFLTYLGLMI